MAESERDAPTLSELFLAFLAVSLSGFGGTLPWAYRVIVEQRRWMTAAEFNEAFSLCQFLPGANVVNFSVLFGSRKRGATGALVSFFGLVGAPFCIVLVLGALYSRYGDIPALGRILAGMAAAACGLIAATAAKMLDPIIRSRAFWRWAIVLAAIVGIGIIRWPLPLVLLGLAPVSVGLAWWHRQ